MQGLKCFNPCFNGRCKRTMTTNITTSNTYMSFNPCFNGRCKRTRIWVIFPQCFFLVSILVLMEDVKEQEEEETIRWAEMVFQSLF